MTIKLSKKFWVLFPLVGLLVAAAILAYSNRERLALHLVAMPDRHDFRDDSAFIEACMRYHIAQWLIANPKWDPRLFENRNPMTGERIRAFRNEEHWVTVRGPGIISGPYIQVVVDDSGTLVEINELFAEQ